VNKDDAMVYAIVGCMVGGMATIAWLHVTAGVCITGVGLFLLGKFIKGKSEKCQVPSDENYRLYQNR